MAPPHTNTTILSSTTTTYITMAPAPSKLSPTTPDSVVLKTVYLGREANKLSIKVSDCPSSSC